MIVSEMTAPGRGSMTATHQGGIHIVIATIAGEAAVAVTVVAAVEVGARIASETVTEKGIGTETGTETGIEIAAGADHTAEPGLEAGVEVRTSLMDLKLLRAVTHGHQQEDCASLSHFFLMERAVTPKPWF